MSAVEVAGGRELRLPVHSLIAIVLTMPHHTRQTDERLRRVFPENE